MTRHLLRLCMPEVAGRGAGLGNELFPWGKAFIASQELDATLVSPQWGRNPRGYGAYFGSSRCDWLWQRLVCTLLPCYRMSHEDFLETGKREFGAAVRAYAGRRGLYERRAFVLLTPGMWGGFHAIRRARHFILSALYGSRGTRENLYDLQQRIPDGTMVVAVHIRRGDFQPPADDASYVGSFNTAIPLNWYTNTCRSLLRHFGRRITFLLVTDSHENQIGDFIEEFHPVTTMHQEFNVCSDILALAGADLLVCSVSSFSMWGAFLSSSPYIWYRPNLGDDVGLLSIWGHEADQTGASGVTAANAALVRRGEADGVGGRGVAVDRDGKVPEKLLQQLEYRLSQKHPATDLMLYGVVGDLSRAISPVRLAVENVAAAPTIAGTGENH